MHQSSHSRAAFSLVELLVVIGVIAILTAILVPAVQKAREAANRITCASNLKQLGLAAHDYENDHRRLPPGYLGPMPNRPPPSPPDADFFHNYQWTGLLTYLLPYLEQDHLYRQTRTNLDPGSPGINFLYQDPDRYLANFRIKTFLCPSDNAEVVVSNSVVAIIHMYGDQARLYGNPPPPPFNIWGLDNQYPAGRTNYLGVAGAFGNDATTSDPSSGGANLAKYEGIFFNRSENRLSDVRDGTSHTLLLGEGLGGQGVGPRDNAWAWMSMGVMVTRTGLGRGNLPAPTATSGFAGAHRQRFSSWHSAGVQFCFADGSVRTVRYGATHVRLPAPSPDWWLLQELAGRKDGAVVGPSSILD